MLEEQPYPELIIVILEPFGCLWAILIRSTAVRTYGQGFQKITLRAVPVYLVRAERRRCDDDRQ
jgi:hypothetical protein